jgi:hypothetical protein
MSNFDWVKDVMVPGRDTAITGADVMPFKVGGQEITDVALLKAQINGNRAVVCRNADAVKKVTLAVEHGELVKGANSTGIEIYALDNPGWRNVKVKASSDLPWHMELVKNIATAFLTAGAMALAGGVASLIVGSPVTLWMFLAAVVSLVLGSLSHWGYLALG